MRRSDVLILIIVLLLPLSGYAQGIFGSGKYSKDGKYITTNNDTTQIVKDRGLKDPRSKFLFDGNSTEELRYSSLEEASLDINAMISTIKKDQDALQMDIGSLAYGLAMKNIASRDAEK
jgi:hypothetical protein